MSSPQFIAQNYIDALSAFMEIYGITFKIETDLADWAAYMRSEPDYRMLSPILDPAVSPAKDARWVQVLRDGETIGCIAMRRYDSTWALLDHFDRLGGERVISLNMGGTATYTGGLFVRPTCRGVKYGSMKFAGHLTALARAICMREWSQDWHFGLVVAGDADKGLASDKYRYQYQALALLGEDTIIRKVPTDYVLPYSSQEYLLMQMVRDTCALEVDPDQKSGAVLVAH